MSEKSQQSSIDVKLDYIQRDISDIKQTLKQDYITREEFDPIKKLVYGTVSIFLITIVGAIAALVLKK
jgi:hypothetical protein